MSAPTDLPIEAVLPALRDALRAHAGAVLQAPPGAGKTTRVPLALLDESWLTGAKIIMLEPRRLAARAAARRMAATLDESVGETVGHRVRRDTLVGRRTRVEVVTEGVLTRMLRSDPALEGVGLVIFDEFHERTLHADLGLALALESRAILRNDLRLLVMSATLDGAPVARLLGDAPVITSDGRAYPVETRWLARPAAGRVDAAAAAAVRAALARDEGDVLVFLPGAGEIRRVEALLRETALPPRVRIAPLHGNLAGDAQDAAIAPSPTGWRKVVLATAIAETSLTIEGVRVVIDTGLARVPRFSPRTGMTRLETVRVSRAAADQRRGRAGRLGPGVCYRLWPEAEEAHLVAHAAPEILEADLAPLALELAAAGVHDPASLAWLDAPPAAALGQARELLGELDALDAGGRLTTHGERMAALGLHPRLAHMIVRAARVNAGGLACDLAALLAERDVLRGAPGVAGPPDVDVRLRLELLRGAAVSGHRAGWTVDREALHRVRAESRALREQLGIHGAAGDIDFAGALLALAYPDRVGQRRPGPLGRFLLRGGRGAALAAPQPIGESEYIVAPEVDDARPEGRIFLAAPLALDDLLAQAGHQVRVEHAIEWDPALGVVARRRERLGAIVLVDAPWRDVDPAAIADALMSAIRRDGLDVLPWPDAARRLRERLCFLRELDGAWPDVSDAALLDSLSRWLAPFAVGVRRREELSRIDLVAALLALLTPDQRRRLDVLAPTHYTAPSGSRVPIDYGDPRAPVLAIRLQEMFGLGDTPRVAGGLVPLTLQLLSPAHRPVQVTRDLAGFWRNAYFAVRKDLRGRYPKHYWPDDPLAATATSRSKPRR